VHRPAVAIAEDEKKGVGGEDFLTERAQKRPGAPFRWSGGGRRPVSKESPRYSTKTCFQALAPPRFQGPEVGDAEAEGHVTLKAISSAGLLLQLDGR
jgi:hypothetical protein